MPNKTNVELNKELVCEHLCHVTDKDAAWVLLQEPGFIGFGAVRHDEILWPPNKPQNSPDWSLVSDLRLFGEKGEWHVWRDWDGKHYARLLELQNINNDALTEYHALWGTKKVETDISPWIKLVEDRGTEIWLPLQGQVKNDKKNDNLPLRLKLKQVVDYDPKYHLAGITDAALIGLVRRSDDELLLPTNLSSCS